MSTHEATSQQPLLQAIDLKKTLSGEERYVRAGTSGEGAGRRFV
ncbi:dipeptide transporter ATP-binding subunit [Escherichia coli]|nr:dipeptide transporter ATP-binding subunit [Escherichia coli]